MILDEIVKAKRPQLELEKQNMPLTKIIEGCSGKVTRDFKKVLGKEEISIIAEIKKASPSKGIIVEDFDPVSIAKIYESIDIDAVSVLTEKNFFKGSDKYISKVKGVNSKPILRKDFIIDTYQIYQSKFIGADAILLITAILKDKLKDYYNLAQSIGLQCLVEVHDEEELEIALEAGCSIVGINNRNLKDFTEDLKNTERIIKKIPEKVLVVSESAIKAPEDIRYLNGLGVNAVLIGETFMRNIKDEYKLREFIKQSKF
ncbi:indole-3-glycerol phosphate synthase TrpC [Clostridium autoethanogenum]|uniref:Indole-3-glycerol phosphate synthase n=2 Tax=Clostridium autoethanogenum TaxID=84023 RepID=A0A3M0SNV1_9CLOT|nr:indole-3-glycerol phosphate synthase TrpC [Clostridium autoethanogenum]AGY77907.1 indole-3-glycerol phosphate synthase TrpC [Clostridium autoethanogenum DSM 10061]ALU38041.1 Indole-3-glycerol phosphate synthase [Clostridium autoethanogenum DSM 10061]OVY50805.1 Indole-3-glycerol phosphate synthase [Clostridium autoethanogenum]RMD00177.1 indole-3-glycerol phosphate synthase TrpC [Clostridium autoethanogenum]